MTADGSHLRPESAHQPRDVPHLAPRPHRLAIEVDVRARLGEQVGPAIRLVADKILHRHPGRRQRSIARSEEHTSELQSLMRISYAVFCLKKKTNNTIKQKDNENKEQIAQKTQKRDTYYN